MRSIVDPAAIDQLGDKARFHPDHYRRILESKTNIYPLVQEKLEGEYPNRFVFIGARSAPFALCKSVFTATMVGDPEDITVKVSSQTPDEAVFLDWVRRHSFSNMEIYQFDRDHSDPYFEEKLGEATHIVVYGGKETIEYYKREWVDPYKDTTGEKTFIPHGPKFSFGVVDPFDQKPMIEDFRFTYGEGCLSPKFYFYIKSGDEEIDDNWARMQIRSFTERDAQEHQFYLEHLSMSEKSAYSQSLGWQYTVEHLYTLDKEKMLAPLWGLIRIVHVDSEDEILQFTALMKNQISTIATKDYSLTQRFRELGIPRVCPPGEMQTPGWEEKYDEQYDWKDFRVDKIWEGDDLDEDDDWVEGMEEEDSEDEEEN